MRKPAKLKHAKVLRVRPGDVVIVTLPDNVIPQEELRAVLDEVQKLFQNNPVGVIVGGSVTVVRGAS